MAKTDLLKEAIADAKAVRETALANAKIALEEAFTPRIQSMLSAKISEEEEMAAEEPVAESEDGMEGESQTLDTLKEDEYAEPAMDEDEDMMPSEEPMGEEEMPAEEPAMDEAEGEDLELEAILRELEDEGPAEEAPVEEVTDSSDIGSGDNKVDVADGGDQDDPGKGDLTEEEGEDVTIDEILKALQEEEGGEEEMTENEGNGDEETVSENEEAEKDLEEAYKVIRFLKSKINEVNLLNAKLLFSNKLFRNHSLNESQKMKVIENFDRAHSLREVKLVFATLTESFKFGGKTKRSIKESYASKASRSTAPKKRVISEGSALSARWKKLANL